MHTNHSLRGASHAARAPLTLLVLLALGLAARPLLACSVCGCDPAASTVGLDQPASGTARLSLEDRLSAKSSGAGDDHESEREDRLTLRGQFPIARRLVLEGTLPIYLLKQHLNAADAVDDNAHGVGDALAGVRWEFFRDNALEPKHVLALVAQAKFATGNNDRQSPPGDTAARAPLKLAPLKLGLARSASDDTNFGYDEHIQLGSGSTDGLAALWYNASLREETALYASVGGRINGTNWRGFRYGHVLLAALGLRERFLESQKLAFSLELDMRNAGQDIYGDGSRDPDSGGFLTYATAGAFYALGDDWFVRAQLEVPIVRALHGTQTEYPVGFVGVAWDVGL